MVVLHTVSGLSSGGFMAVQHHVAFSKSVSAVGVLAGGPYWCSNANLAIALSSCSKAPALIDVDELVTITHTTAASGTIDLPLHLIVDRAWLFSGTQDTTVHSGVVQKLATYYARLGVHVDHEFTIPAAHAFVTNGFGSPCGFLGAPFINNCGFDAAGALLEHAFANSSRPLRPAVNSSVERLVAIDQRPFAPIEGLHAAGLADSGFLYVPAACSAAFSLSHVHAARASEPSRVRIATPASTAGLAESSQNHGTEGGGSAQRDERGVNGTCRLHVAYHGCGQAAQLINSTFSMHAGYNEWAEANAILVLYPQVISNAVLNPKGCWDWWGYTGPQFASRLGLQLSTVRRMVEHVAPALG